MICVVRCDIPLCGHAVLQRCACSSHHMPHCAAPRARLSHMVSNAWESLLMPPQAQYGTRRWSDCCPSSALQHQHRPIRLPQRAASVLCSDHDGAQLLALWRRLRHSSRLLCRCAAIGIAIGAVMQRRNLLDPCPATSTLICTCMADPFQAFGLPAIMPLYSFSAAVAVQLGLLSLAFPLPLLRLRRRRSAVAAVGVII